MLDATVANRPYLREEFLSEENLQRADETLCEVFARMLGLAVEVAPPPGPAIGESDERTAIVGFSGSMRGCCEIQMNESAASKIATAMLGGAPIHDEDSLDDAVGEICNMIAGGWKDRVPSLSSFCALSPPTIITGRAYKVHMVRPSIQLSRCYHFEGDFLFLTLRREDTP